MADSGPTITVEQYDDLADLLPDDLRVELIDGELIVSRRPPFSHGIAAHNLVHLLLRAGGSEWRAYIAQAIQLSDAIVVPDVIVMRADRVRVEARRPDASDVDVVVEVLSPSNRSHDLGPKRARYLAAGVPQYWVIDRDTATMSVFAAAATTHWVPSVTLLDPFPLDISVADLMRP